MKDFIKILKEPKTSGILIPLIITAIFLIIPAFFNASPKVWSIEKTPFIDWLNEFVQINSPYSYILSFILILCVGALLVRLNKACSFIKDRSMLLFFFYLFFSATNTNMHLFDFSQLSIIIFLIIFWQLFSIYELKHPVVKTFNIGLFIALGTLLSIELALFFPIILFGIQRLKGLSFKTFISLIIGIITPYLILIGTLHILNYDISIIINSFLNQFVFSINFDFDSVEVIYLSVLLFTSIISIINILNDPFGDKIKVSRMLAFLSVSFIYLILLFFMRTNNSFLVINIGIIFVSILNAHYFSSRSNLFVKILFYIQIVVCLIFYLSNNFHIII